MGVCPCSVRDRPADTEAWLRGVRSRFGLWDGPSTVAGPVPVRVGSDLRLFQGDPAQRRQETITGSRLPRMVQRGHRGAGGSVLLALCISVRRLLMVWLGPRQARHTACLLYTSDAADD